MNMTRGHDTVTALAFDCKIHVVVQIIFIVPCCVLGSKCRPQRTSKLALLPAKNGTCNDSDPCTGWNIRPYG